MSPNAMMSWSLPSIASRGVLARESSSYQRNNYRMAYERNARRTTGDRIS